MEFTAKEENRNCLFVQQVFVDNLPGIVSVFRMLLTHILLNENAVRLSFCWMLQELLDHHFHLLKFIL